MKKLLTLLAFVLVVFTANAQSCPDDNHPHMIDLGLPSGTKWACCNVGADKPETYGGYYSWGEMETKTNYTWKTYIHCDGNGDTCYDLGSDIAGTQYDVAHVKWGGNWRMPTQEQYKELLDNCLSEWDTLDGINGRMFTSKENGNSIFLPSTGYRLQGKLMYDGQEGNYRTSNLSTFRNYGASSLYFSSNEIEQYDSYRYYGITIRPVTSIPMSTIKGDVNGDGDVSVNDVAMIVNYILGNENSNFIIANADINGDGEIDINDVMGTVSIILGDDGGNGNGGGDTPSEPYYDLCPDNNHPHMIDLGLPSGLKWACCNVGATEPFEKGGYFAWGETEGHKLVYDTESYSHCYYNSEDKYYHHYFLGYDISGTQYDAAHVKWGGGWRMPTKAECDELANYYKGVYYLGWHNLQETENKPGQGRYFIGPNGKKLYFPHAAEQNGNWREKPWSVNGYSGYSSCWTSTHDSPNDPYFEPGQSSYIFYASTWGCGTGTGGRVVGLSIRPVHP